MFLVLEQESIFKKFEVETAEQWKMNARAQDKELSGHQDILDSQGSWQV